MAPFLSFKESTTAALPGHSGARLTKLFQTGRVFVCCVEITGLLLSVGDDVGAARGGGNVDGNDIPLSSLSQGR